MFLWRSKGFMTIELMIATSITILILLFSGWSFYLLKQRSDLKHASHALMRFIHQGQVYSRSSGSDVYIQRSHQVNQWSLRDNSSNEAIAALNLNPSISVDYKGFSGGQRLYIAADQLLGNTNGRFILKVGNFTQSIVISRTGRPRLA